MDSLSFMNYLYATAREMVTKGNTFDSELRVAVRMAKENDGFIRADDHFKLGLTTHNVLTNYQTTLTTLMQWVACQEQENERRDEMIRALNKRLIELEAWRSS